ncbi:GCN5 family acetyltransferase [Bacillus coahuilensis m2-6]|uniref:GCN5 family acetyltransferase n=1 Tax=Bacillus coahuilensis p1.1.43 TaxID=1150625 RepID=A0A147K4A6_9BACI|nr:GCN5 family acetyltransferase [Bacillus coahuilensis p1.1.43]KUP05062.1 GCN5 family acetyltransferase [Bacillus coahuilensis m2-6]
MNIRQAREQDLSQIVAVHDQAFNNKGEGKLVVGIHESDAYIPKLSLVAEDEHRDIVGHLLLSKAVIVGDTGEVETLALAPVSVLPALQKKGIGSQLINVSIARARELGFQHIVVLGHSDYYPTFGFKLASKYGIQCPFPVPDEAYMVLELIPGSLKGVKGTVKYAKAFQEV